MDTGIERLTVDNMKKDSKNISSSMSGLMEGMQDRERDDQIDDISELSSCPFSEGTDAAKNWYVGYSWVDRPEYVEEVMDNNQFEIDEVNRIAKIVAEYYNYTTEKYDRSICTGGFGPDGGAMFGCSEETRLSLKNGVNVEKSCSVILDKFGIPYEKFHEARVDNAANLGYIMEKWDGGFLKEFTCEFKED